MSMLLFKFFQIGNRLASAEDAGMTPTWSGAFDFVDGSDTMPEYEYDKNGNLTKDSNRNISSIEYNSVNWALPKIGCTSGMEEKNAFFSCYSTRFALSLPSMITFGYNGYIKNTYSALGEKLKVNHTLATTPLLEPAVPQGGEVGASDSYNARTQPVVMLNRSKTYCGNVIYDALKRSVLTDEGYVTFAANGTPCYHYFLRDHLGNIRVVLGEDGTVEQKTHYYPFGGIMYGSTNQGLQPNKYGGKELDRTYGLDSYDFGARSYFADRMQWMTMDPLCEEYYDISPYAYCLNNPVNNIDPYGMRTGDFIDAVGKILGNDGLDDGKVYLLKTTEKSFDSGVASAGITKNDAKRAKDFVKSNSGNKSAFEGSDVYGMFVEIEGDINIRQQMVDVVNVDDGSGGTSANNNREHGGFIRSGNVIRANDGSVGNPKTDQDISIEINSRQGESTFHSHPSGIYYEQANPNQIGRGSETYFWLNAPSPQDIQNASATSYVFARRERKVYVYNNSGILGTIPQKYFVGFKQ